MASGRGEGDGDGVCAPAMFGLDCVDGDRRLIVALHSVTLPLAWIPWLWHRVRSARALRDWVALCGDEIEMSSIKWLIRDALSTLR